MSSPVDNMTDEELTQALVEFGLSRISAEMYVEMRRGVGTDKKIREILGR